jgi:hypothetical protein
MQEEKKEKGGCSNTVVVLIFLLFLLAIWGLTGMMDGKSFLEGIGDSISALVILAVVGAVGYGVFKTFYK